MNNDKQINKLQETLDTANQTIADVSKKLEELKADKGFDFREWHEEDSYTTSAMDAMMNNILERGILGERCSHNSTMRVQAEQIIKQHWKRIIGDYVPDWRDDAYKVEMYYNHDTDKVNYQSYSSYQQHPEWFYFPEKMKDEIKAEIERMKNLYNVDVVKYYLTGRF